MDVKQLLIDTLEPLGYPVFLQGSLSDEDSYPESFFTFFNNDSPDDAFYDNEPHKIIWSFDLNFYSVDPALVNSMLLTAKRMLKAEGWKIDDNGHDIMSDEPSHTGRGLDLIYIEKNERED